MNRLWHLLRTTIGRKLLLSLSGIVLVLFVVGHVLGNLTIYFGPSALNSYAHWLQESPILWLVRLSMLMIVIIHIGFSFTVTSENHQARSTDYQSSNPLSRRLFNNRMIISGVLLLLFIIGHVAHLTLGVGIAEVYALTDTQGYADVFTRVVSGFLNPWIAWSYIGAMLMLAVHLRHTVRALFQTMGFFHEQYFTFFELVAWVVSMSVVVGFISIPLSVQLGWLVLP